VAGCWGGRCEPLYRRRPGIAATGRARGPGRRRRYGAWERPRTPCGGGTGWGVSRTPQVRGWKDANRRVRRDPPPQSPPQEPAPGRAQARPGWGRRRGPGSAAGSPSEHHHRVSLDFVDDMLPHGLPVASSTGRSRISARSSRRRANDARETWASGFISTTISTSLSAWSSPLATDPNIHICSMRRAQSSSLCRRSTPSASARRRSTSTGTETATCRLCGFNAISVWPSDKTARFLSRRQPGGKPTGGIARAPNPG